MCEKLRCEIVQDLLPSYIDGLTNDVTTQAIREHLDECESCRNVYERMQADETEPSADKNEMKADIDFLKKIKRQKRFDIILVIVLLLGFFAAFLYHDIYQVGKETTIDDVLYEITISKQEPDQSETVDVEMRFSDYKLGYPRLEVTEEDGCADIKVYATHRNYSGSTFSYSTRAKNCRQISINGVIVWSDDELISRKASEIYKMRTDYIGDIVACNAAADVIGIKNQFGSYKNELTTSARPYDWRLIIQHPIQTEKKAAAKDRMFADACALLALIGNLDSVTWDYVTDEGQKVETITKEDASAYIGYDIKTCVQSAAYLQKMLIRVGILLDETSYIEADPMGKIPFGFELTVEDQTDEGVDVCGIAYQFYVDDTCRASGVMFFGKKFRNTDTKVDMSLVVDTDFLQERLTDEEVGRITLTLGVRDEEDHEYPVCSQKLLSAEYGKSYRYILKGSYDGGFYLTETPD